MLNIKEIMNIIPHRSPFLLVDRIEEMEVGKRAVGKKCVTYNEPFFAGHFPQEPVMPGVLIIEALAQVGAVCCLSAEENKGKIGFLGGVNKAKFRGKVVPGDDQGERTGRRRQGNRNGGRKGRRVRRNHIHDRLGGSVVCLRKF